MKKFPIKMATLAGDLKEGIGGTLMHGEDSV